MLQLQLMKIAPSELAEAAGLTIKDARAYIKAISNEAHTGLWLLAWPDLSGCQRLLEVGAGGGLLTAFLQSRGFDLTAIEPVGQGFEATQALRRVVSDAVSYSPRIIESEARDLDPKQYGFFELIFSVNVIEHFQPMKENLNGLARIMAPGGVQVHTCPNYHLPYEPHYGIPLLPFAPHLSTYLLRREVSAEGLWRSLNFITSSDLRAYAKEHGFEITFKRGTLGEECRGGLCRPSSSPVKSDRGRNARDRFDRGHQDSTAGPRDPHDRIAARLKPGFGLESVLRVAGH